GAFIDIAVSPTFSPQACSEPQQSVVRAEIVARELRVLGAEPRVTCFEGERVGTPAAGAQRATLSTGERTKGVKHSGRRKRSARNVRRRERDAYVEPRRREPQRAVLDRERDVVRRSMELDFVRLEESRLERARRHVE